MKLRSKIDEEGWGDTVDFLPLLENRGFAGGNNAVIKPALNADNPVDYVLLLNPDTLVQPGAIKALVTFMLLRPKVGICGSRLEYPDGSTQHAARRFPGVLSEMESMLRLGPVSRVLQRWRVTEPECDQPHPTSWLPGASMMIRREVFDAIGLLDDSYFMYFEEVDFCLRAKRAGWQVWYVPESRVIHLVGQSSGVTSARPKRRPQYWFDSRRRYFEKNHGKLVRMLADVAFATGLAGHKLRCIVSRKPDPDPPYLLRDFVRYSLFGSLGS
jgi:N-acetylglucosaminyl-diphospho-decaprenol L-rhamnosyltransferase